MFLRLCLVINTAHINVVRQFEMFGAGALPAPLL